MNAIVPLTGETFGESIGLISAEVFDLQTEPLTSTTYWTV